MTKALDYLKALLTLREKERERVLVRVPPWGKKKQNTTISKINNNKHSKDYKPKFNIS